MEVFHGRKRASPLDVVFLPDAGDLMTVTWSKEDLKAKLQQLQATLHDVVTVVDQVPHRSPRTQPGEKPVNFDVGDFVLVGRRGKGHRDKLHPRWTGPAVVVERISDLVFRVRDINEIKEIEVHAEHLKKYADKDLTVTRQLREYAAHGGTGFEIDAVIDHRRKPTGELELLAKWYGFADPTWEPVASICEDVPELVRRYARTLPPGRERDLLEQALGLHKGTHPDRV
jgi:ribosomal protein L21E